MESSPVTTIRSTNTSILADKLLKLNGIYDKVYLERLRRTRVSEMMLEYRDPSPSRKQTIEASSASRLETMAKGISVD
jgi:hypothetical protein